LCISSKYDKHDKKRNLREEVKRGMQIKKFGEKWCSLLGLLLVGETL
jgi:hypothetical protein